jgi:hypothetical protein
MLYIQEKNYRKQIELLRFLNRRDGYDFIVWLYPESKLKHLFGHQLCKGTNFEGLPITKYDSDAVVKRTCRTRIYELFMDEMNKYKRIYSNNCDSCVLYKPGEYDWFAAVIGHEGVCIVNDDRMINELISSGFNVSHEKPVWW